MFRGVAKLTLDGKGRLVVPARYRDALLADCAGRLVITADPSKCLLLYPQPEWEPIQEKIMQLPALHPQARALQRLLVGHAEDVEMDGAGRLLVSTPLREFAELQKHVMLVGQGIKFELWDEAKWMLQRDEAIALPAGALLPEMQSLSL
ncbi:MAG: division/cell wall cluster transcriptional repressor MraZ [Betaproteobacteria bacterium]|nr:division/cell wall cluster transcriptional repressor MraZ [Betaproteobacteria bacterium]